MEWLTLSAADRVAANPLFMRDFLKNAGTFLCSALLTYVVAELAYSYAYRWGYLGQDRDGWYFLEADQTIHFDPDIGYRLTRHPSPHIRITMGEQEYSGVFRGNNRGFQDGQDFVPARPAGNPYRVAVLGDSFSAEPFVAVNWPDRVEAWGSAESGERPLELLNFSVYSGGLANWRNIVVKEIEAQAYQLDLLVIPVFANDLFRPFMGFEARNTRKLLIGRAGFDPDRLPQTLAAWKACCAAESEGYVLTAAEWQRFQQEGWHPDLPRPAKRYLAEHTAMLFALLQQRCLQWWEAKVNTGNSVDVGEAEVEQAYQPDPALGRGQLGPEQWRLVDDIHAYAQRTGLAVVVVRVPDKDELINQAPVAGNVLDFAERLGAPVLDGMKAFDGVPPAERPLQYFPHDGHWNQGGSDRFARFMLNYLQKRAVLRLNSEVADHGAP